MATESKAEAGVEINGATGGRKAVSWRAIITLAVVALAVYCCDQLTKYLISSTLTEGEQVRVIGDILTFHFVKNPGAAFSLASGTTWVFSIAASAVTIFIIGFARRIHSIGWAVLFGMLLGGTTGNLTDRLFREPGFGVGHVVDFIQVYGFPAIFNIADSFICASMALFIILTIRGIGLDGRRPTTTSGSESIVASPTTSATPGAPSAPTDRP